MIKRETFIVRPTVVRGEDGKPLKIKSGKRSEAGGPMALPYFNVERIPEISKAYGPRPTKLVVYFPSDRIEDFFDDRKAVWRTGANEPVLIRSCDEETCFHRLAEDVNGVHYEAGTQGPCICPTLPLEVPNPKKPGEMKPNPDLCAYGMNLKAFVGLPPSYKSDNPACYLFENHSRNGGNNILSELKKIQEILGGRLIGVPFELSVEMVPSRKEPKKKYPIWHLQMRGMFSQLRPGYLMLTEGIEEAEFVEDEDMTLAQRLSLELDTIRALPKAEIMEALNDWAAKNKEDAESLEGQERQELILKYNEIMMYSSEI